MKPLPVLTPEQRVALEAHTYLTAPEAAVYTGCSTVKALYSWSASYAVPKLRRGRTLLFARRDLDAALRGTR